MVDFVVQARFEDQTSAGAAAATASLDKYAVAADRAQAATDKTDQVVRKAGPSATALAKRYDETTASAATLEKAERALAVAQQAVADGLAKGSISQQQANSVIDSLSGKVTAARTAHAQLSDGLKENTKATDIATASSGQLAFAQRQLGVQTIQFFSSIQSGQGVLTAFIQQGHQVVDVALSTGTGLKGVTDAFKGLFNSIGGLPALLGVAVVGAFTALAVQSENAQRSLNNLSNTLRVTRDDYAAVSSQVQKLSKEIAATTNISASDALAAGSAIAGSGVPTQQLERLIKLSADVSRAFGEDIPTAAGRLVNAFKSPKDAAQELADKGLRTMTQALADQIKHLQDAGDRTTAYNLVIDAYTKAIAGAHDVTTPFQQALSDLANLFTSTSTGVEGLGKMLMDDVVAGLRAVIQTVKDTIAEFKGLRDTVGGLLDRIGLGNSGGTKLPGPTADAISAIGNKLGLSSAQVSFGQRVAMAESQGNQFNAQGGVLTSSAGALGMFQLMPGTAAKLGVNPANQQENMAGGLSYIAQLWSKYGGDTQLVAMAYNWGPGNVDAFLKGVKTIKDIPKETTDYVQKVTGSPFTNDRAIEASQIIDVTGGSTGGIANRQLQNDATKAANSILSGDYRSQREDLQRTIELLTKARKEVGQGTESWNLYTRALQDLGVKLQNTKSPLDVMLQQINDQTKQIQASNEVYDRGQRAIDQQVNALKAQADATKFAQTGTQEYTDAVEKLTAAYNAQSDARADQATHAYVVEQERALEVIQKETELVTANVETRNREVAVLKERQDLMKQGADLESEESKHAIAVTAAVADATTALDKQRQVISDIQQFATSAFDSVGNAITQAFVSGQGAAVNFGNVMKGILTQIINMMLKLAVINPILNGLFGGSATTLGDVGGVLGFAGGGAGGGGSLLGGAQQVVGAGRSAYGLFNGGGFSTGFGPIDSVLGTTLWGGGTQATTSALGGLGPGVYGPATASQVGATTVGSLLGGAGVGFGLGSLVGSGIQSLTGKTGPGPMIGAGVGSLAGAAIGSIVPGVGTLIGGLFGGLFGGGGGGLFGPGPKNPYLNIPITADPNGFLGVGNVVQQKGDYTEQIKQAQQQVADFNKFLTEQNVRLAPSAFTGSKYGIANIGQNITGLSQQQNLADSFGRFRFTSSNQDLGNALQGKQFAGAEDFGKFVTSTNDFLKNTVPPLLKAADDIGKSSGNFHDQLLATIDQYNVAIAKAKELNYNEGALSAARDKVVANMIAQQNKLVDESAKSIANRNRVATTLLYGSPSDVAALDRQTVFNDLDTQAQQQRDELSKLLKDSYGVAYATTAEYADRMTALEDTLGKERLLAARNYDVQIITAMKQSVQNITSAQTDLEVRRESALAVKFNNPLYNQKAQLFAFDAQAQQQRDQMAANYRAVFGDLFYNTSVFVSDLTKLNNTLGKERANLANQLKEQLSGQATGVVVQLSAYANQLRTSNLSPLSPQAQLSTLEAQFDKASGNAAKGNVIAFGKLPGLADQLLNASRAMYGSGTGYVTDFNKVLDALKKASTVSPDTLTASVLQNETRTQTQTLVGEFQKLRAEVVSLKVQVQQNGAAPVRIAA